VFGVKVVLILQIYLYGETEGMNLLAFDFISRALGKEAL
jgi:hypothetical protein